MCIPKAPTIQGLFCFTVHKQELLSTLHMGKLRLETGSDLSKDTERTSNLRPWFLVSNSNCHTLILQQGIQKATAGWSKEGENSSRSHGFKEHQEATAPVLLWVRMWKSTKSKFPRLRQCYLQRLVITHYTVPVYRSSVQWAWGTKAILTTYFLELAVKKTLMT